MEEKWRVKKRLFKKKMRTRTQAAFNGIFIESNEAVGMWSSHDLLHICMRQLERC